MARAVSSLREDFPKTMKALAKSQPAKGIWMVEEPLPHVGPDDVLIRVERTAICGTDVHIYEWDDWARETIPVPMIIGHEFAGRIVAMGENVKNLEIGQRVSGEGHIVGQSSRNARAGRFHLDPDTKGVGINRPGAFAEYCSIPAFNVVPLPDFIDMEMAAILDPLGNATHAVLSFNIVGEDILITGAGPIGIMAAAICRHIGARHIVLTDVNQERLNLARHIRGLQCVNVREESLEDVMQSLGMKEGFDIGLEMSGVASAFDQMAASMIMGGKIALMGIPPKPTLVDWRKVIFKALTLKAIYGREMYETWYKMLAMLESGLDLTWLITHRFPADDYARAFEVMVSGKSGKVILEWP